MRILHVAAEVAPLIKTGGLADVVGSLPAAQRKLGHDVTVLVPGYPGVIAQAGDLRSDVGLSVAGAGLLRGKLDGDVELLVVEHNDYFNRPGNPYLNSSGQDWGDNHRRFALLGRIGAELSRQSPGFDVVHAHDWHAGLTPAYLEAAGEGPVSCFTIHNLAFQGNFTWSEFLETGLPEPFYQVDGLEYYGGWSFMKAGLNFSDVITTVSPTYAHEILTDEAGMGFAGLLRQRHKDLHGILNGVDYAVWSPALDAALPQPYDFETLEGKAANKAQMQSARGLSVDARCPLIGVVSRLTRQKGLDFALEALTGFVEAGCLQLLLLGTGDDDLEAGFAELAARYPKSCAVNIGYDETESHQIFGAADAILVPSLFEPCGLTQLYGLRYGTLPLVRNTGGLADTVTGFSGHNLASATGFQFAEPSAAALSRMLGQVTRQFNDIDGWRQLMQNAMTQDFSWKRSAERYLDLYRTLQTR